MTVGPVPPPQVVSELRQKGTGEFVTTRARYPLGALRYSTLRGGRGVLELEAGAGSVLLSGGDADTLGPGAWRLKIDHMVVLTTSRVAGRCDLRVQAQGPSHLHLSCRLRAEDGLRMSLRWTSDASAPGPTP